MPTTRPLTRDASTRSRCRSSGWRRRSRSRARSVLQRRKIFAGRCRLCAVPAALFLPRSDPADRPDREVPAAEGLGRYADEAAFDAFLPEPEFELLYRRTSSAATSGCRSSSPTWLSQRSSAGFGAAEKVRRAHARRFAEQARKAGLRVSSLLLGRRLAPTDSVRCFRRLKTVANGCRHCRQNNI